MDVGDLLFQGHALNAVDAKGRVSVPAAFRALIEQRARVAGRDPDNTLMIGEHEDGGCLAAFDSIASAELRRRLEDGVAEMPAAMRRKALAEQVADALDSLETAKFDGAGRMVLSSRLREEAGITDLAFFRGVGSTFEIWSPARGLTVFEGKRIHKALVHELKERGVEL